MLPRAEQKAVAFFAALPHLIGWARTSYSFGVEPHTQPRSPPHRTKLSVHTRLDPVWRMLSISTLPNSSTRGREGVPLNGPMLWRHQAFSGSPPVAVRRRFDCTFPVVSESASLRAANTLTSTIVGFQERLLSAPSVEDTACARKRLCDWETTFHRRRTIVRYKHHVGWTPAQLIFRTSTGSWPERRG